ncbi:hypothetical protein GCM10020331_060160 [Ectobacillus funiculus]
MPPMAPTIPVTAPVFAEEISGTILKTDPFPIPTMIAIMAHPTLNRIKFSIVKAMKILHNNTPEKNNA